MVSLAWGPDEADTHRLWPFWLLASEVLLLRAGESQMCTGSTEFNEVADVRPSREETKDARPSPCFSPDSSFLTHSLRGSRWWLCELGEGILPPKSRSAILTTCSASPAGPRSPRLPRGDHSCHRSRLRTEHHCCRPQGGICERAALPQEHP